MWWPWSKRERRDSGGDFSDAVVRLIEAQAAGTAADASSTAAVEAAAGALSRAFASAGVDGLDGCETLLRRPSWHKSGEISCGPETPCTLSASTAWAASS